MPKSTRSTTSLTTLYSQRDWDGGKKQPIGSSIGGPTWGVSVEGDISVAD